MQNITGTIEGYVYSSVTSWILLYASAQIGIIHFFCVLTDTLSS